MRILQVTPRYAPNTGGVENHVQAISERMVERGHEVTVLSADAGAVGDDREVRNGVSIRRHRALAPGGTVHISPGITRTVLTERADVVHAHNYHSLPVFFAALGVRKERFVVTPHYHGESADDTRNALLSMYEPFGGWAVRSADAVVAVSEWERRRLLSDLGVQATVVPNGIDGERFTAADSVERDTPWLLTVGRLEEYKGVQHLIRALPKLPEYNLLVVGDGPYREHLRSIAEDCCVTDRVELLGYVDDERLAGLYTGASAYVTLSEFEAFGMTVAESLTAGTPCVVREQGALQDWVDEDGVVGLANLDSDSVADACRRAASRGRVRYSGPTWDDVTDRLCGIYDD